MNYGSGRDAYLALVHAYAASGMTALPTDASTADRYLSLFAMHLYDSGYRSSTMLCYRSAVLHFWRISLPASHPVIAATSTTRGLPQSALLLRHYTAISTLEPLHRHPFPAQWLLPQPPPSEDPVTAFAVLLGFLFYLRVSEYATTAAHGARLAVEHLRVVTLSDGVTEALQVTISTSKTDLVKRGSTHVRAATGGTFCPVARFRHYAATRRDSHSGAPALQWRDGRAFTDAHLNAGITSIAVANGAAPDFFSSHSLRSGGVAAALATGLDQAIAMREGRWLSVTSLVTYIRLASNLGAGATAAMVGCRDVPTTDRKRVRATVPAAPPPKRMRTTGAQAL